MKRTEWKWLLYFFVLLAASMASIWLTDLTTEQLVFNLHVSMKGANSSAVWKCALFACGSSVLIIVLILKGLDWLKKNRPEHKLLCFWQWLIARKRMSAAVALLICMLCVDSNLEMVSFIRNQMLVTTVYQEYYVEPESVEYQFPEQKRNLIYIFLESMEVTYTSTSEGGVRTTDLIPELRGMAQNHVNFSPDDGFGGGYTLPGTTWTMAAMVAQTSGLPVKLPFDGEKYYSNYTDILPGVWSLGDILAEAGYHQVLMMGSDSSFAGRKDYFMQHGGYEINDYQTARQDGRLSEDYHEFWGYEDEKLFAYAKEELLRLAANEEPFNLTMLTVDTHFENGYICSQCTSENRSQYANVIRCSSRQVGEFVQWIQQQDFYENTTIIISGDHLSMDSTFFRLIDSAYDRQVYNCIINPAVENPKAYEKNRVFTTLDMFPTTLEALGVSFEGNRLGLGTSLFSGQPTLAEELGMEELRKQLSRYSNYYNYHFLYHH